MKVDQLITNPTWVSGPYYFLHPVSEWPNAREDHCSLTQCDLELKRMVTANTIQISEEPVNCLFKYFSSWVKLQKSVAWILNFKDLPTFRA